MTCHEAREQFTALVDDALRVDERATLDAHLAECAECRRELTSFQRAVGLVRAIEPARAPAGFVDRVVAAAQPTPWPTRLARRVFMPWTRLPIQAAAVVVVAGLAVIIYRGSVEQQKAVRQETIPPSAVQPAPPAVTTPPAAPPAPVETPAPPPVAAPAPQTAPPLSSAPAKTDDANKRAQLEGKAQERNEVLQSTPNEARSKDKSEGERLMAKSRRDVAPVPAPSTGDEKLGAERQRESDDAAERVAQPRAQSAPLSRTGPDTGRKPGRVSDVVASLATADVEAAERQLIALAAQHGGSQTGRRMDAAGVTVELDIPRERYADFARAAAAIGTFSGPAATAVTAPTVRVDVRLDLRR